MPRSPLLVALAVSATALTLGCARPVAKVAATGAGPAIPASGWLYEVVASPRGEELTVQAAFAAGTDAELTVEEGAEPFVRDVEVERGGTWVPIAPRGSSWFARDCAGGAGCRVRYRYLLGKAGRERGHVSVARASDGAVEAAASTWLLRPLRAHLGTPFRVHARAAPGESFVSGVFPTSLDSFAGASGDAFQLPYGAVGRLRVHELAAGRVTVAILPGKFDHEEAVLAWVERSARTLASFYGGLPVPRLLVVVRPVAGSGVGFGTTIGGSGAAIAIDVGAATSHADFATDWILTHEMVHTALPDLRGPHHWLEEGLATYVEPLARMREGLLTPEELFRDWISGMPNGLPEPGDLGLDVTHTWGRTYWGGALFCFLADLEIRGRTEGRKSLDDALRAIVAAGGNIGESWTMERVISVGDAATGVPVLRELYGKMAHAPAPVDLAGLWKELGVVIDGKGPVTFDDTAPRARLRLALVHGRERTTSTR